MDLLGSLASRVADLERRQGVLTSGSPREHFLGEVRAGAPAGTGTAARSAAATELLARLAALEGRGPPAGCPPATAGATEAREFDEPTHTQQVGGEPRHSARSPRDSGGARGELRAAEGSGAARGADEGSARRAQALADLGPAGAAEQEPAPEPALGMDAGPEMAAEVWESPRVGTLSPQDGQEGRTHSVAWMDPGCGTLSPTAGRGRRPSASRVAREALPAPPPSSGIGVPGAQPPPDKWEDPTAGTVEEPQLRERAPPPPPALAGRWEASPALLSRSAGSVPPAAAVPKA